MLAQIWKSLFWRGINIIAALVVRLKGTKDKGLSIKDVSGMGGFSSADILQTTGEGVNFSRFCADVLYGRPLTLLTQYANKTI